MKRLAVVLLGAWASLQSTEALALFGADNSDLSRRVERIEQRLSSANQGDLVMQLERLQQEVQQLRGELEIQQHTLDALNRRLQDQYRDLDSRLGSPSGNEPSGALAPPVPAARPQDAGMDLQPRPEPSDLQSSVSPQDAETVYKTAFNQLKAGQYPEAIRSFQAFITRFPGGIYADNAQYWLGEAWYVQRDYDKALAEFDKVVKQHPQSPKVPDALLKMGYIQTDKGNARDAGVLFQRLVQEYPESTAAGLAQKQLERLGASGR